MSCRSPGAASPAAVAARETSRAIPGTERPWPAPGASPTRQRRHGARLTRLLAFGDAADPLQVISVPPLFLDAIVAEAAGAIVEQRCMDDCVVLACSYAHLGIAAQVRAAELTIADTRDRSSATHGTLSPRWEDGLCTATPSCGSPPSGA